MGTSSIQNQPLATPSRILAASGLVGTLFASATVWYFDPSKSNFFPVCPLFSLTGFACPGCGLTRGFHALFHGDLYTAVDFNALTPLFALIFAFLVASLVSVAVRGKGLVRLSASPVYLFGFLILLLTFGVLRNLPYSPFTFLYP